MQSIGLFAQHPLQGILHHAPKEIVKHQCPSCGLILLGEVRQVYNQYKDHVEMAHFDELEDCGSCGCYHFPSFYGDCREDWERF